MKNNNNYKVAARGIREGGFVERLFLYSVFYIPTTLVLGMILDLPLPIGINAGNLWVAFKFFGFFIGLAVPFILWEKSVRRFRRKHNLSIWKNVSAELEQMAIDEQVAKEHKAHVNNGIVKDPSGDKTDIGYWFGLLEKGAITQVEYEVKKKELL